MRENRCKNNRLKQKLFLADNFDLPCLCFSSIFTVLFTLFSITMSWQIIALLSIFFYVWLDFTISFAYTTRLANQSQIYRIARGFPLTGSLNFCEELIFVSFAKLNSRENLEKNIIRIDSAIIFIEVPSSPTEKNLGFYAWNSVYFFFQAWNLWRKS